MKFERRENKKIGDCGVSYQAILSYKGMPFRSTLGGNHEKVFGKVKGRSTWLSPFRRTETLQKWSTLQTFLCIFVDKSYHLLTIHIFGCFFILP